MSRRDRPHIAENLECLGDAIHQYKGKRTLLVGLTDIQHEAMCRLLQQRDQQLTISELTKLMELSRSTATGIMNRLCEKGLVLRVKHETDFRRVVYVPSEKGRALDKQMNRASMEITKHLLDGMTAEEIAEFNRLIQSVLTNMNRHD